MANRQNIPQSIYPIVGDVESTTGDANITVVGIQKTPFAADPPQTGQVPVMGSDGVWHPEDPVVSGPDEPGTDSSKPPVQVGGIDDGNLVRELRIDTYGGLRIPRSEEFQEQTLLVLKALLAAYVEVNGLPESDYALENFVSR